MARKVRKVVKVSSNPNPTPAKGQPTWSWSTHAWNSREGTGPYGEPTFDNKKKVDNIKVNSNPVPGKTVVSPMAQGLRSGGLAGLALGAIAAYKAEIKTTSEAKKKKNRMN